MNSRASDNAWARRLNQDEQKLIHLRWLYEKLPEQERTKFKQLMKTAVKLQNDLLQLTANSGDVFLNLRLEIDNCTKQPGDRAELQPNDVWHAIPGWESFSRDCRDINRRLR